jgi:hypothetical protein
VSRYGIALRTREVGCGAAIALCCAGCGGAAAGGAPAVSPVKPAVRAQCAAAPPRLRIAGDVAPSAHVVAPPGAVALRLCRYSGLNDHPRLSLVRTADVRRRARVARLVGLLDRLPDMTSPVSCPNDDGSRIVALVSYPRRRVLPLDVALRGCQTVSNGRVHRTAARPPGPAVIAALKRLTARRR